MRKHLPTIVVFAVVVVVFAGAIALFHATPPAHAGTKSDPVVTGWVSLTMSYKGADLTCVGEHVGSKRGLASCDYPGFYAAHPDLVDAAPVVDDEDWKLKYVKVSGRVLPCVTLHWHYQSGVASCDFVSTHAGS